MFIITLLLILKQKTFNFFSSLVSSYPPYITLLTLLDKVYYAYMYTIKKTYL